MTETDESVGSKGFPPAPTPAWTSRVASWSWCTPCHALARLPELGAPSRVAKPLKANAAMTTTDKTNTKHTAARPPDGCANDWCCTFWRTGACKRSPCPYLHVDQRATSKVAAAAAVELEDLAWNSHPRRCTARDRLSIRARIDPPCWCPSVLVFTQSRACTSQKPRSDGTHQTDNPAVAPTVA